MNSARPPIWVVLKARFLAQPRKTAVLCVLFVVLVVVYLRLFLKDGGAAAAQAGAPAPSPAVPAKTAVEPASPVVRRYQPEHPLVRELTRDPFLVQLDRFAMDPTAVVPTEPEAAPVAARPAGVSTDLLLQATLCGPQKMAWINGRCMHAGEEVDGYVLDQIEPTRVTLLREGARRVLSLEPGAAAGKQ